MPAQVSTYTEAPAKLLQLLNDRLPTSLPLLRRIQSIKFPGGTTPDARIVFAYDSEALENDSTQPLAFSTAYVAFSNGPDTQMWFYSTIEDSSETGSEDSVHEPHLTNAIHEIIRLKKEYGRETWYPGCLLLGTLNSRSRRVIEKMGRARPRVTGDYDKWLFRVQDLPREEAPLPEGMHWGTATMEDCHYFIKLNGLPRRAEMLVEQPNLVIKLEDNTPITWAFLGADGSLICLECQEPYRRRGLARALAAKLFRQGTGEFGDDGWCSADVTADNEGSRGMCKRLNGTPRWVVSWILLDLDESIES